MPDVCVCVYGYEWRVCVLGARLHVRSTPERDLCIENCVCGFCAEARASGLHVCITSHARPLQVLCQLTHDDNAGPSAR